MDKDKQRLLTQLLSFVKEQYDHPDNKEFAAGIRAMVLADKEFLTLIHREADQADPESLRKIEAYLSLDYGFDSSFFPDYMHITEEAVRTKLQADYREMLRYQYGTRNHKIDFPEFCRYATLQIELLVNYYFERKYASNLASIIQAIKDGNTTEKNGEVICYFNPSQKIKDVADIALKYKIQALQSQFTWHYPDISGLLNIVDVRNRQSHRSLRLEKDMIQEYEDRFKAAKVWFFQDNKPIYKKAIEQGVVTQKEMNEYSFQVWLDSQPFDEVIRTIKNLATTVSKVLSGQLAKTEPDGEKSDVKINADSPPEEKTPKEDKEIINKSTEEQEAQPKEKRR